MLFVCLSVYLVLVPFLTSHMEHLKASALFLYVQTEQSQNASSEAPLELPAAPPLELRLRLGDIMHLMRRLET